MKKFEITEEQIKELSERFGSDNQTKLRSELTNTLKEWFPEVFETKIKNGWYKHKNGNWKKWLVYADFENNKSYGIITDGSWSTSVSLDYIKKDCELENNSEVEKALINEFEKQNPNIRVYDWIYNSEQNILGVWLGDGRTTQIFNNGIWTKFHTKQEAEKLLNAKII